MTIGGDDSISMAHLTKQIDEQYRKDEQGAGSVLDGILPPLINNAFQDHDTSSSPRKKLPLLQKEAYLANNEKADPPSSLQTSNSSGGTSTTASKDSSSSSPDDFASDIEPRRKRLQDSVLAINEYDPSNDRLVRYDAAIKSLPLSPRMGDVIIVPKRKAVDPPDDQDLEGQGEDLGIKRPEVEIVFKEKDQPSYRRPRSSSCSKKSDDIDQREDHLGESRQYWRDIILGVNDGLVSTFLLVAGVTGADLSSNDILLTAIAGTIAGAISMAAGEYVATKTQQEVLDGEIKLEEKHIAKFREDELSELNSILEKIGILANNNNDEEVASLQHQLLHFYRKNDEAHLQLHAALEFGVIEDEKRNPFIAGGVAFCLFFLGALPSVVPFIVTKNVKAGFIAAAIFTTTALLFVGAVKTWATKGNLLTASLENFLIAAGGGAIAYGIGFGFDIVLQES